MQRWETPRLLYYNWTEQYRSAVRPVGHACLTSFNFEVLGQIAHKRRIFENPFRKSSRGHRFTCRGHIWRKSVWEVDKVGPVVYRTKNPASSKSSEPPSPILFLTAENFLKIFVPNLCMCTKFGPRCGLPDLFLKDWIFRPNYPKWLQHKLKAYTSVDAVYRVSLASMLFLHMLYQCCPRDVI